MPLLLFVSPGHQKIEKSEDALHHSGRFWFQNYKKIPLNMTPDATSSLQPLFPDTSPQHTTAETELEKPVFRLAPFGHEQSFNVIALGLCESHIDDDVLRQIVSEASNPVQKSRDQCVMALLCLFAFSPLGESRPSFLCGVPFLVVSASSHLSLQTPIPS